MGVRLHPVAAQASAALSLPSGSHLLVAVSGGPDSLCLLHVLHTLAARRGWSLHAFHLNHQLRGDAADADAAFVGETAAAWGIPATLASADVAAEASATGTNLHAIARTVRYRMLAALAAEQQAAAVLVAHHADDQAETVLMHLLRGAGSAGLRGIRPVVPWAEWAGTPPAHCDAPLLRPLLAVRRAEIEAYCAEHGLAPRHDATNDDPEPLRNRVRHELLPVLHTYNPQIVAALGRTAATLADDHAAIVAALDAVWPTLASVQPGGVALQRNTLLSLPVAVQHEAIRRAHRLLSGATLPRERAEQVRRRASATGALLQLPGGIAVTMTYNSLHIGKVALPPAPQLVGEPVRLDVPGSAMLAEAGALVATRERIRPASSRWETWLDATVLPATLLVRSRLPGDTIVTGAGQRRIQDILTDARIPRQQRQHWPLVIAETRILWVVGIRVAAWAQASARTPETVRIRFASPHVADSNAVAVPTEDEGADGA